MESAPRYREQFGGDQKWGLGGWAKLMRGSKDAKLQLENKYVLGMRCADSMVAVSNTVFIYIAYLKAAQVVDLKSSH